MTDKEKQQIELRGEISTVKLILDSASKQHIKMETPDGQTLYNNQRYIMKALALLLDRIKI